MFYIVLWFITVDNYIKVAIMSFSVKKTGGRMWHEARKQEKKIRGMLVDYRRRAERRRDYYEKIVRIS